MPFTTKDLGNGVQQVVYEADSGGSPLGGVKETLSLVELGQRVELGKLDQQLKQNQVAMAPFELEKKKVDLANAKASEYRAQTDALANGFKSLPGAFLSSFEMGQALASRYGIASTQNKDGTVSLAVPGANGKIAAFTLDPRKVGDPEKLVANENNLRDEWRDSTKPFAIVDSAYKTIQQGKELKSGPSDAALIYSYARMLDPIGSVRQGDVELVSSSNLESTIKNLFLRNKDSSAPFLTPEQRSALYEAAQMKHGIEKQNVVQLGRHYGDMGVQLGGRREQILTPVASLSMKDIYPEEFAEQQGPLPQDAGVRMDLTGQKGAAKPKPQEAGFIPSQASPQEKKPTESKYAPNAQGLNQLLSEGLFVPGRKR